MDRSINSKTKIVGKRPTLTAGGWDHARFLDKLKGKRVVVMLDGEEESYYEGVLEQHDKWTVLIKTGTRVGHVLVYKSSIESISLATDPSETVQ